MSALAYFGRALRRAAGYSRRNELRVRGGGVNGDQARATSAYCGATGTVPVVGTSRPPRICRDESIADLCRSHGSMFQREPSCERGELDFVTWRASQNAQVPALYTVGGSTEESLHAPGVTLERRRSGTVRN